MNEAAQKRLRNPPPKPVASWIFAAAAVCAVVARVIFMTDGPLLLAKVLISVAVVLAVASFVVKLRRWLAQRPRT